MYEEKKNDLIFILFLLFVFKVPDNKSNRAEFIRVPPDASVIHVKELLTRLWCNGVGYL